MGVPLQDITIYHEGKLIKDAADDWQFRRKVNFIADFYHNSLNGYKPLKTGRICIIFNEEDTHYKPYYFGSICNGVAIIDADLYLSLTEVQQSEYILELLHTSVMKLACLYGWEVIHFQNAYDHIVSMKFVFTKEYPVKKSPDRKYSARVILEKTETEAALYALMTGKKEIKIMIFKKKNWYWWDSTYSIAKNCKWLSSYSFGVDKDDKKCYLSISSEEVLTNLVFKENDF